MDLFTSTIGVDVNLRKLPYIELLTSTQKYQCFYHDIVHMEYILYIQLEVLKQQYTKKTSEKVSNIENTKP